MADEELNTTDETTTDPAEAPAEPSEPTTERPRDESGRFAPKPTGDKPSGEAAIDAKMQELGIEPDSEDDDEPEADAPDDEDEAGQDADEDATEADKSDDEPRELSEADYAAGKLLDYGAEEVEAMSEVELEAMHRAANRVRKRLGEWGERLKKPPNAPPAEDARKADPDGEFTIDQLAELTADDLFDEEQGPAKVNALVNGFKSIYADVQQLKQAESARQEQAIEAERSKFYAEMVDKVPTLAEKYGNGSPTRAQKQAREELQNRADLFVVASQAAGIDISEAEAMKHALHLTDLDAIKESLDKELQAKVAKARRKASPRGSSRRTAGEPRNREEKADQAIDAWAASQGVTIPD